MSIEKSDTFLLLSGTYHRPDLKHLHVVCSDINENGLVLIVPIRTLKAEQINFDNTCMLQKHEHEWLRFQSYIEYKRARLVSADALMNELNQHSKVFREPVSGQVLLKIINGFCRSKFTPQKIKRYLNCAKPLRPIQPSR